MKKQAVNSFSKGLITDLNPLSAPADILIEARNIDYLTTEGDQIILQKRIGNDPEVWIDGDTKTVVTLSPGFKPLAVKELNNIAYILGYNEKDNLGEIGTFPSPDYNKFKLHAVIGGTIPFDAEVEITSSFDDGLEDESLFSISPDYWKDEYIPIDGSVSDKTYTIVVTNKGEGNDTFEITYDTDIFYVGTTSITIGPGETDTFKLELRANELGLTRKTSAQIFSISNPDDFEEAVWDYITIYAQGAKYVLDEYRSIAEESGVNISFETAVHIDNKPYIRMHIVGTPGNFPYDITLYSLGTDGRIYYNFALRYYPVDGSVETYPKSGGGTTLKVHQSRIVDVILDYVDDHAVGIIYGILRPSSGYGSGMSFKGDVDYDFYHNDPPTTLYLFRGVDNKNLWWWGDILVT